jgi:glutathione peroxidase
MKRNWIFTAAILVFGILSLHAQNKSESDMDKKSFYDFSATSIEGVEIPMSEYKDKVILVVNTASKCGFTPQYEGLEKLHDEYGDKGLVVLGFPSNQFANQEPGSNDEIATFCQKNYGVSFQMFSKIDVNGENAHPIYQYLKDQKGGTFGSKIKWNFTKFLLDKEGNVVKRVASNVKPEKMEDDIVELLQL